MFKKILILSLLALSLTACDALTGEEIGRISINKVAISDSDILETEVYLKKGEKVSFWTEMDIKYKGDLGLAYMVEVSNDSALKGSISLNALETNPTMMEVKSSFGNKTSWSYTGKMDFMTVKEDGNYLFRAFLQSSDNPSLIVNKAELVLKR